MIFIEKSVRQGPVSRAPLGVICNSFTHIRDAGASSAPNVSRFYLAIFHACHWEIVTLRSYFLMWRRRDSPLHSIPLHSTPLDSTPLDSSRTRLGSARLGLAWLGLAWLRGDAASSARTIIPTSVCGSDCILPPRHHCRPRNTISSKLAYAIGTDNKILHIITIASDLTMPLSTTNY